MSHYNQNYQPRASNPVAGVPTTAPNYVAPPKSDVNAIKDDPPYPHYVPPPQETKTRGDGFWRGCCAGWCCYCCLDMCF